MASPIIQIRRSAVAGKIPTTTQLSLGELAINTYDGKIYIEQDQGAVGVGTTVIVINPWNVGVGSEAYNINFTAGFVGIGTTNAQSTLDVRGPITVGVGTVGINSIFSTTDIQSWYYTNKSKSVTGDDTSPQAIYVGASGTAMFMVGDTGNDINQFTLSTPYDVSTAGAAVTFFSTATQETVPTGIDFNSTGTKMFICGQTGVAPLIASGEYVHEYSLSTAWNLSSGVGYTTSFNVTQDTAPQGVTFGNDGSKMYVVGSTGDAVYQYSLSTPYSLASGVTYDNISLVVGTNPLILETLPTDISFNYAGTVLWLIGSTQDRIYEFRLGTAWDISTAVFYDDVYIGFNELTATGLQVIPEQNVAYIVGSNSDTVFQYSTNTPAIEIASSGISSVASIVLNNETRVKDKLYVKGNTNLDSNLVVDGSTTLNTTTTITSGTLTVSSGTITAGNVAATLLAGNTTTNITMASGQTTGILTVGGASQTGAITLGQATTSQTLNLATGVSVASTTKTINLGTGGASGSFTNINIGPTAGVGTVIINSGTNLGIGTTNPTSKLHVVGDVLITGFSTLGTGATVSQTLFTNQLSVAGVSTFAGITTVTGPTLFAKQLSVSGVVTASSFSGSGSQLTGITGSVSISTDAPAAPSAGNLWYNSNLGRTFIYYNDGDSAQWVDAAPFNVGIITSLTNVSFSAGSATSPSMYFVGDSQTGFFSPSAGRITLVSVGSSILNVNPSGISVTGVVTATDFNSTSDISLKEHIHSIKDPLGKVLQINGVGFRWKDTKEDAIGVIAQDIEEILPELVKNNDHIKTVNYNGLIGVLIEAIKEQQRQIEELKSIIKK